MTTNVSSVPPRSFDHDKRVIVGYETVNPADTCCCASPRPAKMKPLAWAMTGVLLVFAFPLAWVPLFLPCSYDPYTRPVYGYRTAENAKQE